MNKKTKIKSTLDSLFSGGKLTTGEDKKVVAEKVEKPEEKSKAVRPSRVSKTPQQEKSAAVIPSKTVKADPDTEPVISAATESVEEVSKEQKVDIVESPQKENPVETPAEKSIQPANGSSEQKVPQTSSTNKKTIEDDALKVAREIDQAVAHGDGDEEHLVIFSLGKELYGVTIHAVESIIKLQAITEVPRTAAFILGVTNLRGTVVPVVDLRKRFNLTSNENTPNTRIVIVNAEVGKVGIVVDEVTEVLKVPREAVQPPPPMSTTIESAFINGIARIADKLVILLDLEKVLASSTKQHNW